jgi:hypothetical protein
MWRSERLHGRKKAGGGYFIIIVGLLSLEGDGFTSHKNHSRTFSFRSLLDVSVKHISIDLIQEIKVTPCLNV